MQNTVSVQLQMADRVSPPRRLFYRRRKTALRSGIILPTMPKRLTIPNLPPAPTALILAGIRPAMKK
ncbi:MAG: hypothetical protein LBE81_03055 [Azonexus sp.]|jgi:hypothetical protein|uniref:hypothetical protein n=1 Tax=Azonexus sp. TaxID=1872668 RepID=UPI00281EE308|nr:hypothetical protein [Azonexus sp.]MDR0775600.1 hypothetical protein [Azonexus sp.]